jgi:carbonic anhydrase
LLFADSLTTNSVEDSIKADVALLKGSPFVLSGTEIVGLKLDTFTGEVTVVEEATHA